MILKIIPPYQELYIRQGANFSSNIIVTDSSTNTRVNVASSIFRGRLKKSYASSNVKANLTCTAIDVGNGVVQITLTSNETSNIAEGRYVFNVLMTTSNSEAYVISEGGAFVIPDV